MNLLSIITQRNRSAAALSYRAEVMADSPIAYWRLGEASGTVAADEAVSNPGAYVGSPALGVTGAVAGNTAVTFAGAQRVTVADNAALRPTGAIAVEAWVNFTLAQINKGIVGKYSSGANARAWALYAANDASGKKLQFAIQTNGAAFDASSVAVTTGDLNDGAWHHIVAVYVPSTTLRIYVDGVADANAATIPASVATGTALLEIGAYNQGVNFFTGSIDEVAIYSTLSAGRIAAHYAARTIP